MCLRIIKRRKVTLLRRGKRVEVSLVFYGDWKIENVAG
jgi:hypothetical protein